MQNTYKNYNELLIIQPFAEEITTEGEWSFVFFNNEYIHCVLKKPLKGRFLVQGGIKTPIQPPDWMIKEAQHIIDTIDHYCAQLDSDHPRSLKTRLDVIRRGNEIRIMEVEMIEPVLYLKYFPGSEKKLAKAIHDRLL